MSNELVNWSEELGKHAKEVASLERPALSQISLRAGVMTYQKQPVPGNKMEAIVIASAFENKYFTGTFNPDKYEAPACYALSLDGEDMAPHEDARDKQSTRCDVCPQNQWGSQGQGKKGKACKQVRRLALLPVSALTDGNIPSAELAVLSVPVTSTKNWANYVNAVAGEFSRPFWAMKTEVRTEPNAKTQFQVLFRATGLVDEEYLAALFKRREAAHDVLLTPYDDSGVVAGAPDPLPNRKY